VINATDFNTHITTSVLYYLSAVVSNGSALLLYLSAPESFPLAHKARKLGNANDGLLDMKNANGPTYSTFLSLEVLSYVMNSSFARLIRYVYRGTFYIEM
jgi:hypothetical protein